MYICIYVYVYVFIHIHIYDFSIHKLLEIHGSHSSCAQKERIEKKRKNSRLADVEIDLTALSGQKIKVNGEKERKMETKEFSSFLSNN